MCSPGSSHVWRAPGSPFRDSWLSDGWHMESQPSSPPQWLGWCQFWRGKQGSNHDHLKGLHRINLCKSPLRLPLSLLSSTSNFFSKNEQCIFHMPNSAWIIAKECHHLPLFEELKWRDRPEWFCPRLYRPKDTDFLPEWGVPGCFANPKPKSIRCFRYRWMETHTHKK